MSIWFDRLKYMQKTKSIYAISAETGVPYSSLRRMSETGTEVKNQYHGELRNAYQRTVYTNLRKSGMSAIQSKRFSWYPPEQVTERNEFWDVRVSQFSTSTAIARISADDKTYSKATFHEYYIEAYNDIIDKLRKSPKPYEDLMSDWY